MKVSEFLEQLDIPEEVIKNRNDVDFEIVIDDGTSQEFEIQEIRFNYEHETIVIELATK